MFENLKVLYRENRGQGYLLLLFVSLFLLIYFIPAGTARFDNAVLEGIRLTNWYALYAVSAYGTDIDMV